MIAFIACLFFASVLRLHRLKPRDGQNPLRKFRGSAVVLLGYQAQPEPNPVDMPKRRLKQAGLPAHYSPHSFRATGITNFLENDDTLEAAQRIASHADGRTTKL